MMSVDRECYKEALEIIATAGNNFRDALHEAHRANFMLLSNSEKLLECIRNEAEGYQEAKKRSRMLAFYSKVEELVKRMDPFFKVIHIFISSNPQWSAITWGALRLLFQLCSNFTSFVEKLGRMIENLTMELPIYAQMVGPLVERTTTADQPHQSLIKSFSYVYEDVMQFFFDICKMFSTKHRGVCYKANLITELFWAPFDIRFSNIIERLKKHKRLLELELEAAKIMEFRIAAHAWEDEIQAARDYRQMTRVELQKMKSQALGRTILELKNWLNAPNWTDSFEAAGRRWIEGTGEWFFDEPIYRAWLDHSIEASMKNLATHQILFVKGKPGFGKTILSMQMVKYLQNKFHQPGTAYSGRETSENSVARATVVYFFFERQRSDSQRSSAALRALLAQLLHIHQQNEVFIDAAVLMMGVEGSGQLHASENEVQNILRFVLQGLMDTYVVLDGLDECGDFAELLEYLFDVAGNSSCKIALVGRPDLPVDKKYTKNAMHLLLDNSQNIADIQQYLRPQVKDLVATGAFLDDISPATIISKISSRSDSMFLWVVLLVSYLRSPVLTPFDRTTSVLNLNLLEGLDELYFKILLNLVVRYPNKHEQLMISKMLNWICISRSPRNISQLHSLLAVRVGQSTSKSNYIQNFKNTLQEMSGALLEVRRDRTVRFIHLSVQEFLLALQNQHPNLFRTFRISANEAHLSLASTCLSYLSHDIPNEPLSGSADTVPSAELIISKLPLLPEACYWPLYASKGMEVTPGRTPTDQAEIDLLLEFCSAIKIFMTRRLAVSGWIEASWLFGTPPSLSPLQSAVDRLISKDTSILGKLQQQLEELIAQINHFASDLSDLERLWGHTLAVEPNEIWQPSINAFKESKFWGGGTSMKVTSLDPKIDASAIFIASQVSSDGLEVGLIKVLPPSIYRQTVRNKVEGVRNLESATILAGRLSSGWKAVYQGWSLTDKREIFNLAIELPQDQVKHQLCRAFTSATPDRFEFPVAFGPSLRVVVVLHSIVIINQQENHGLGPGYDMQALDLEISGSEEEYWNESRTEAVISQTTVSAKLCSFDRASPINFSPQGLEGGPFWHRAIFSPTGNQFLVVQAKHRPTDFGWWATWSLISFEACRCQQHKIHFKRYGSILIQCSPTATGIIRFHPFKPMIGVATSTSTSIWSYREEGSHLMKISNSPLEELQFSNCGRFLAGLTFGSRNNTVVIPIPAEVLSKISFSDISDQHCETNSAEQARFGLCHDLNDFRTGAVSKPLSSDQPLIIFDKTAQFYMSLEHHADLGAIILRTSGNNESVKSAALARIPKLTTLEQSYSTLLPSRPEFDTLRVVLGMAMQETYHGLQTADLSLPAILERKKDTIQTFTSDSQLQWDIAEGQEGSSKKRPLEIEHKQSRSVSKVQRKEGSPNKSDLSVDRNRF